MIAVTKRLTLKPGKDKKVRRFYPWVFRDELAEVSRDVSDGEVVALYDAGGKFVAWGTFSARSHIAFRTLTLADEPINKDFFVHRLEAALKRRKKLEAITNAYRVVHAEADFLPGLIVDRYAGIIVLQVRTVGMERLRPLWLEPLMDLLRPRGVFERSDMEGRREEGLEPVRRSLHGTVPERVEIQEYGLRFLVDVQRGLKTGFYLDQRENRKLVQSLIEPRQRLLDLFAYTGAFSVYAAVKGAECLAVEQSREAIALGEANARLNGVSIPFRQANAFEELSGLAQEGQAFDFIVIDPPAIAKSKRELDSLKWAIWKLVYGSLPLLRSGGRMLVCTCTYHMDWDTLTEAVRLAASDRGVPLRLLARTTQASDHPIRIHFPESLYLRCLLLERD